MASMSVIPGLCVVDQRPQSRMIVEAGLGGVAFGRPRLVPWRAGAGSLVLAQQSVDLQGAGSFAPHCASPPAGSAFSTDSRRACWQPPYGTAKTIGPSRRVFVADVWSWRGTPGPFS